MPLFLRTPGGPIHSLDDWATTTAPRQWANGRAARELARAWWKPGVGPEVPTELAALLSPFVVIEEVQVEDGARLRIAARDANGPMAVYVRGISDDTFGDRIESVLVDAARRIASDHPTGVVDRLQVHASRVLAPSREGLPQLGELRVELLRDLVAAVEFAATLGAARACFCRARDRAPAEDEGICAAPEPGRSRPLRAAIDRWSLRTPHARPVAWSAAPSRRCRVGTLCGEDSSGSG